MIAISQLACCLSVFETLGAVTGLTLKFLRRVFSYPSAIVAGGAAAELAEIIRRALKRGWVLFHIKFSYTRTSEPIEGKV